ncbi:phospholipase/carboxylesterase [Halohasta litchfieldiae]|jgi:phospholipase/carboxylesterase|uniref:Phospholipase/carboxylesterase n=1 Tax=Halohasta litchfieldiae TaxID=1073996 RepID=A0A1H6T4F8_9EURY|nr:dienelactone hydrolase family protein [Halohasta litchfieldiae]ATW86953.1 phospholipase/carboxylesterase [Halohasta litchfieldiae]SEI71135.1 phospholipase/carboxylesterase [Halohasta litchfieldiae]
MSEMPLEHVHIEPETPSDGAAPAVFVLHGRGANEQDLLPIAKELPDELHIVSFRAPDRLQGGYTWYDLDLSAGGLHQSQPDAADFDRSLGLVDESVKAAVDAYDLDSDRLGLLGFSQGAITSMSLLLEAPSEYQWVVGLHGYLPASHHEIEPEGIVDKPVFIAAGNADEIIPAARSEAAAERFKELGATVTYNVYDAPHGVSPPELEDLVAFVENQL